MGGLGVNIGDFVIDLRYQAALDNDASQAEIIVGEELFRVDMDSRVSVFTFTLGYTF